MNLNEFSMSSYAGALSPQTQAAINRFLPYLQEVQRRLTTILIVFAAGAAIGFIYYQKILTFVMGLFNLEGITIVLTSPYQFLNLAINTALVFGTLAVFPFLVYFLLSFIRPALRPREFKILLQLLPVSLALLVFGFVFGFWVMNLIIKIFYKTAQEFQLDNLWDISQFFSQTLVTAASLALVFQFPIVLTALLRLRIVKRSLLTKSRHYIYAGCLVFAALLPPTDLLSLALITLPLIVLFELTLIFNPRHKLFKKGGER